MPLPPCGAATSVILRYPDSWYWPVSALGQRCRRTIKFATIAATTATITLIPSSVAAPPKNIESGRYDPMGTKPEKSTASSTNPPIRLTAAATNGTVRANKVPMSSAGTDQRRSSSLLSLPLLLVDFISLLATTCIGNDMIRRVGIEYRAPGVDVRINDHCPHIRGVGTAGA